MVLSVPLWVHEPEQAAQVRCGKLFLIDRPALVLLFKLWFLVIKWFHSSFD